MTRKSKTIMSKVDTIQADNQTDNKVYRLTDRQVAALQKAGLTDLQIKTLPSVSGLTSEQLDLAESIGVFPPEEGELTLDELAALPTDTIDYSDIPKPDDEYWANAILLEPKPTKKLVTIRLDPDVLEYFRRPGPGYQTRINTVLRLWIKAHPNPPQVPNPHAE
jgi:uncharacterized protein (DUF4415 family)